MSNGLFFLTDENFSTQEGPKGKTMCVNLEGYALIFFYSTNCTHCQSLIPNYKKLPSSVGGCTFGMVNINASSGVVTKSKTTNAPIRYVPLIVLYINGKPFMRYDGPQEFESIKRFVIEIAQEISKNGGKVKQQKQNLTKQAPQVPAYTIGQPKNSGPRNAVAYGAFDSVYGKKN